MAAPRQLIEEVNLVEMWGRIQQEERITRTQALRQGSCLEGLWTSKETVQLKHIEHRAR